MFGDFIPRMTSHQPLITLIYVCASKFSPESPLAILTMALRSGRSTIAVAGVFGAGKTRSLTFLLAWLAITPNLKIGVVHKENPAGRAIPKLLASFDLQPHHKEHFVRPVGREEVEANTAKTEFD